MELIIFSKWSWNAQASVQHHFPQLQLAAGDARVDTISAAATKWHGCHELEKLLNSRD
jgi:hypothetical protein